MTSGAPERASLIALERSVAIAVQFFGMTESVIWRVRIYGFGVLTRRTDLPAGPLYAALGPMLGLLLNCSCLRDLLRRRLRARRIIDLTSAGIDGEPTQFSYLHLNRAAGDGVKGLDGIDPTSLAGAFAIARGFLSLQLGAFDWHGHDRCILRLPFALGRGAPRNAYS